MKRVHIVCEGPTEQTFVREVLQPEFPKLHLIAILPGKTYAKRQSGGRMKYARVWPDIVNTLKMDGQCFCTTLIDYYALGADFPANEEPRGSAPADKATRVEQAVASDVARRLGRNFDAGRFRCHLSMHEFEGLLFSDPPRLADGLGRPDLADALSEIRGAVESPEHINDDSETAPSKRLKRACPGYDKVIGGNVAALAVGVAAMRQECAHFRAWLEWLRHLAETG